MPRHRRAGMLEKYCDEETNRSEIRNLESRTVESDRQSCSDTHSIAQTTESGSMDGWTAGPAPRFEISKEPYASGRDGNRKTGSVLRGRGLTVESKRKYSPSRLGSLEACPKFVQDEDGSSEAAERGTRIHKAVEESNPDMLVDQDEREVALKCMYERQLLVDKYPNFDMRHELKLDSSINRGTADLVLLNFDQRTAVLADYKMGVVPVSHPERNIQVWSYAYALMSQYEEIDTVHCYIIQPACFDQPLYAVLTRSDIPKIKQRCDWIIDRAESPDAEETPNDKVCGYCTRKARCPKWQLAAIQMVEENLDYLPPASFVTMIDRTPDELSKYRAFLAILEGLVDQGKKEANAQGDMFAQQGIQIPGYRVQHKVGNLKVIDTAGVVRLIQNDPLVNRDLFVEKCLTIKAKPIVELLTDAHEADAADVEQELKDLGLIERGAESVFLVKDRKADLKQLLVLTP